MALTRRLPNQKIHWSKVRNCKSNAWDMLHMHDAPTLQWSCSLAVLCMLRDWLARIFPSLLFKWLHHRVEEEAACIFLQSLQALDNLNAPATNTSAVASTVLTRSTVSKILAFWKKPDLKANHYRSVCQADVQVLMLIERGIVKLHRGPQPQKPFVMLKCIFMNNLYYHFILLCFLDLI